MDEAEEPQEIPLVATVGPQLDGVISLLREFLHQTGAARALALVEHVPGEPPALIDCPRLAPIEVTRGEEVVAVPHGIELDVLPPALPGDLRQLPKVEVRFDESGEVQLTGTIGGLEHMARGAITLAGLLGPRDVAITMYDTTTPDLALTISARTGEQVVVAVGDVELELPEQWPPTLGA